MQLNPYLFFNGDCAEAFKFYQRILDGKDMFQMTYAQTPMAKDVPANWVDKIVHVRMTIGNISLLGADAPPGRYEKPQGFSVNIGVKTEAEADRIFTALSEGGKITLPIQKTFWALRFGMLVDQFGIAWMVNCEQAA